MKKTIKIRRIIGVLVTLATLASPSLQAYTDEYTDAMANSHLQAFPVVENKEEKEKHIKPQNFKEFLDRLRQPRELDMKKLNDRDRLEIAFQQMQQAPDSLSNVIDANLVNKLNLIRGETRPNDHFMERLTTDLSGKKFLLTTVGAKRFVDIIAQPTTDLATLRKRQNIIRELVNNDALRSQCNELLAQIQKLEPLLFDIYTRTPNSESERMDMVDAKYEILRGESTLSVKTRTGEMITLLALPMTVGAAWLAKRAMMSIGLNLALKGIEKDAKEEGKAPKYDIAKKEGKTYIAIKATKEEFIQDFYKKQEEETPAVANAIVYGAPLLIALPQWIKALATMKIGGNIRLSMQERLIGMATYLSSLKKLACILEQDSAIGPLIPELKKVVRQLEHDQNASKEFNRLNELLRTRTFKEGEPSRFSSPGNIVSAYRNAIKEEVRKEYAAAMNLLGELDVYVALANKIKAHEKLDAQFCFAKFIEQSDKPVVKAENFWNPFVDPKIVVGNDVSLNSGQERDIILTGPNTGGKSTIMKGLMFSVLLAQTFGIAPAKSLTITPFTKLLTYLNIADDTGAGVSLFKAEVNQAKAIMETVQATKPHEFVFLITDEMFTGTSPDKGEALSFDFASQLAEFPNCIFMQATHFKKLTELPELTNGICKNYYTGVIIEAGKVVKYTYKLVPGISPISTAEQIAKEDAVLNIRNLK